MTHVKHKYYLSLQTLPVSAGPHRPGADESPLIQQVKRHMLDTCPIGVGDQVLDVGCGLGHEVRRLAQQVGPRRCERRSAIFLWTASG